MAARGLLAVLVLAAAAAADEPGELVAEFRARGRGKPDRKAFNRRTDILFRLRDLKSEAAYEALLTLIPEWKRPNEFMLATVFLGPVRDVRHMEILAREAKRMKEDAAIRRIGSMVKSPSPEVRRWIVEKGLRSRVPNVCGASCRAAGNNRMAEAVEPLRALRHSASLDPKKSRLAFEAARALALMHDLWKTEIGVAATHKSPFVRIAAATLLPSVKAPADGIAALGRDLSRDPDRRVRKALLDSCLLCKHEAWAAVCIDALENDPLWSCRTAAHRALRAISGRDFDFDAAAWRLWLKDKQGTGAPKKSYSFARYYGHVVAGEDICFVVDLSGSMQGKRLEVARKELEQALAGLSRETRFNLLVFSDDVRVFKKRCIGATPAALKAARAWIEKYFHASGQTNTWAALEAAFGMPELDTVFLLSDGSPSIGDYENMSDTIEAIYALNWNRCVTIHTIALSLAEYLREKPGSFGEELMTRIAEATGGDCRIVTRPP